MADWLMTYRWWILVGGGLLLFWLLGEVPSWRRVAQGGRFTAERDFARWRLRYAYLALGFLVPLVVATLVLTLRT
jgi:uncharacterized membrane protein